MPTTLTAADVVKAAKSQGFTGDDPLKARDHLLGLDEPVGELEKDNQTFALKDWAPPKPARRLAIADDTPPEPTKKSAGGDETPSDMVQKITTNVIDGLVKSGAIKLNRPQLNGGDQVRVKSMQERMYETQIKSGRAFFEKYEHALVCQKWWQSVMFAKKGDFRNAEMSYKRANELSDQIHGKALSTTSLTGGASLVPEIFIPELIKNVLQYGVFSQLTRVYQTTESQLIVPRHTGDLTVYWPSENAAITESNTTYDNVTLNARTAAILVTASMQILNDAHISVVDETMTEMARMIAKLKDQCLLVGDATATYGGILGFVPQYGSSAATDGGGYLVIGGDTSDATTHAQLCTTIGRLPTYAHAGAVWTCTNTIKANIFDRLSTSTNVGGLLKSEVTSSGPVFSYMGYPIIVNDVMNTNTNTGGDVVDVLFGNFGRASKMLDLLDLQLDMSDQRYFDAYKMGFRAVARFDFNVHDVGTTTAAGPVVSLWQT